MWRRWAIKLGFMLAGLAFFIAVFEGLLSSGVFNDLSVHWIPPEYKAIQKRIHDPSDLRSIRHPYVFNEPIAGFQKGSRIKSRIIVLGDSVTWGFGLPYEQGWLRKFRRRVADVAPGVEVLGFALYSWATKDQLDFLEVTKPDHGMSEADLVIVSFIVNDPDLRDEGWDFRKKIDWNGSGLRFLRRFVPNTVDFLTGHIDAVMEVVTDDYGITNWLNYLWSEKNMSGYRRLLRRFKTLLDEANVPFIFALMPLTPDVGFHRPKFELMASMLDELGIPYVDLLPRMVQTFGDGNYGPKYRRLWANPADAHPGDAVTTVMAEGVLEYLQREGILSRLAGKRAREVAQRFAHLPLCDTGQPVVLSVPGFKSYLFQKSQPYLRIEGVAYQTDKAWATALKAVYLRIGEDYFPALPRLPLDVKMPNGEALTFKGMYALDVPADRVGEQALREIVAVTEDDCLVIRRFKPALTPTKDEPLKLYKAPVLPFDALFRRSP